MLNDLAAPIRMGLSAFEVDDSAEPVDARAESAVVLIHEGRFLAWEAGVDTARDPVQLIDYVPVRTARRRVAVEG